MKGQTFVLASVMILIAMLLLQNAIRPFGVKAESYLNENFVNLRSEMTRTVELSLLNGDDIPSNLDGFIAFSKDAMKRRGYVEDASYSISAFGNNTIVEMNLTLGYENSFMQDSFIINRTVYA